MRRWWRVSHIAAVALVSALLLAPAQGGIDARISCPRNVEAGEVIQVGVQLENEFCSSVSVRLLSTLVGNADEMTGSVRVVGPSIAERSVDLEAATDLLPGTCMSGVCATVGPGPFVPCARDADCTCRVVTPTLLDVSIATPESVPTELDGKVAMLSIASEVLGMAETDVDDCLIAVPEPVPTLQVLWALATIGLLHQRRIRLGTGAPAVDFEETRL